VTRQETREFKEAKLSYRLTRLQDAFNALVRAADDITDRIEEEGRPESRGS
jgi:hypothetical protein